MKNELKAYEYIYRHQLYNITPTYYGTFALPDQAWGTIILADGGSMSGMLYGRELEGRGVASRWVVRIGASIMRLLESTLLLYALFGTRRFHAQF